MPHPCFLPSFFVLLFLLISALLSFNFLLVQSHYLPILVQLFILNFPKSLIQGFLLLPHSCGHLILNKFIFDFCVLWIFQLFRLIYFYSENNSVWCVANLYWFLHLIAYLLIHFSILNISKNTSVLLSVSFINIGTLCDPCRAALYRYIFILFEYIHRAGRWASPNSFLSWPDVCFYPNLTDIYLFTQVLYISLILYGIALFNVIFPSRLPSRRSFLGIFRLCLLLHLARIEKGKSFITAALSSWRIWPWCCLLGMLSSSGWLGCS